MPHSSGGGSHGGGSHGGSHHSNAPRVSRRPYHGARRYIYYYPGTNRSEYLYCSGPRTAPDSSQLRGACFFAVVLLLVSFLLIKSSLTAPVKTDVSSYDSEILIEDRAGILEDTSQLCDALSDFRSLTGVAPAIVIVRQSGWMEDHATLESYAYDEYLRLFRDEKHWLFVFSVGDNITSDLAWEGMIGNDVGSTISSAAEQNMTQLMQNALLQYGMDSTGSAITSAFQDLRETVMEPPGGFTAYLPALIPLLFAVFLVSGVWFDYQRRLRLDAAFPVGGDAPVEHHCANCGCMYVEGTVDTCPYCSTPILSVTQGDEIE